MISFSNKGDYKKITAYFEKASKLASTAKLEKYAKAGVKALQGNTPKDTGLTASSWYYEIENQNGVIRMNFCNSNIHKHIPIAIILQLGHGTGTGGWVEGRDYINPSLQPVFEQLARDAWREVTSL